jgi:hypothetical protein
MLNGDLKSKALEELKIEESKREALGQTVISASEELYKKRQNVSITIIPVVENYINSIANTPKEFDMAVEKLQVSYNKFKEEIRIAEKAYQESKIISNNAGAGVAAGVGIAALAPGAAMAVATTFGAASTGTAISALSGAAATNAALAWIGGGALAAGGGGMAGGNALLALAGPVGWGIGLVSLVGGGYLLRQKNEKFAKEANKAKISVGQEIAVLKASLIDIKSMNHGIEEHSNGVLRQLNRLEGSTIREFRKRPYTDFSENEKKQLMALVNNVNSLSKLLVKNVQR